MKKFKSPFSAWGWAGIVLLIIGIILLVIAFTSEKKGCGEIEALGSICSIVAFIWVFTDSRVNRVRDEVRELRQEMRGMRQEMRGMREEIRGMREEIREEMRGMREDFEKLPRRIAEELRNVLGR